MHQLAHWGARAMGPPSAEDLEPGWLAGALQMAFPPATSGRFEFRIGGEVASLVDGAVIEGPTVRPEAVISGDAEGFYRLVVDRDLDAVSVDGSRAAVRRLLEALPPAAPERTLTAMTA
jgi:hypothetical protein